MKFRYLLLTAKIKLKLVLQNRVGAKWARGQKNKV